MFPSTIIEGAISTNPLTKNTIATAVKQSILIIDVTNNQILKHFREQHMNTGDESLLILSS
jgi:hypothetical protein